MKDKEKIEKAMNFIMNYGGIEGSHHKAWCIDQIFRILSGEHYAEFVRQICEGIDGPDTYSWDEGIPP